MRIVSCEGWQVTVPDLPLRHLILKIFQCAMHFYKIALGERNIPVAIGFASCA